MYLWNPALLIRTPLLRGRSQSGWTTYILCCLLPYLYTFTYSSTPVTWATKRRSQTQHFLLVQSPRRFCASTFGAVCGKRHLFLLSSAVPSWSPPFVHSLLTRHPSPTWGAKEATTHRMTLHLCILWGSEGKNEKSLLFKPKSMS